MVKVICISHLLPDPLGAPSFLFPGMMSLSRWLFLVTPPRSAPLILHPAPWVGSSVGGVPCHSTVHHWPEALASPPDA